MSRRGCEWDENELADWRVLGHGEGELKKV